MARWGHFRYGQARYDEPATPAPFTTIKPTHMRDLHIWPTNPFDDPHIGIRRLLDFGTHNLGRMTDDDPTGIFAARVTATTPALAAANSAFADDKDNLGHRETAKQIKALFRQTLPAAISKIYVVLAAKYGENAPELRTFFSGSRGDFNRVPDGELATNLGNLVKELTARQTDLNPQVVTDATALKNGWAAVHQPSEDSATAKDTSMQAKRAARTALQLELFLNLLAIAQNFPRQPEAVDRYMQPGLLEPPTPGSATPPTAPAPTGNATK